LNTNISQSLADWNWVLIQYIQRGKTLHLEENKIYFAGFSGFIQLQVNANCSCSPFPYDVFSATWVLLWVWVFFSAILSFPF